MNGDETTQKWISWIISHNDLCVSKQNIHLLLSFQVNRVSPSLWFSFSICSGAEHLDKWHRCLTCQIPIPISKSVLVGYLILVIVCFITGPSNRSLSFWWLASVVVCNAASNNGPVRLHPVRATPCFMIMYCSYFSLLSVFTHHNNSCTYFVKSFKQ